MKYQYRIQVNDSMPQIVDEFPSARWTNIAQVIEERGGVAQVQMRAISDEPIEGFLKIGQRFIGPWHYHARVEA